MSVLRVFNPSHDEVLAASSFNYTPTKAARLLGRDLAELPAWCGVTGNVVLLEDVGVEPYVLNGCELTARPDWQKIERIEPWGWDTALACRLQHLGAPQNLLPDAKTLDDIRECSSRYTAVGLLRNVVEDVPETIGESVWCRNMSDVRNAVSCYGKVMLKAPWSGSGRGVFPVTTDAPAAIFRRAERILALQGGIEAEPCYNRIVDLAMEFTVAPDGVVYEGLSVFRTSAAGQYEGNIVASDAILMNQFPLELHPVLSAVRESLSMRLATLLCGHYTGILGVDMMVVMDKHGKLRLHPCVEVNLRQTMGWVALCLRRLLPTPLSVALYALRPLSQCDVEQMVLTPRATTVAATFSKTACI